ncbi:MAG: pantoate--beta-alanine ligase [Thermodesulfobacteriota bacterium]|nr:pantoate--beta-alanine ligase [Thermodesulfobacteriota bacterium]
MDIVTEPGRFQEICRGWRAKGVKTALIPTMGYFHEGHLSLMRWAGKIADKVLVSLFVNPTQFGPNEDLETYPRDPDRDAALAEAQGADVLFTPRVDKIYAPDHGTWVRVPGLEGRLCGKSRPTHFQGVATVVAILLHLAVPDLAVFGEKDWQQLVIIRKMVKDLHFGTEVVGRPAVREPDGLALSSRNTYLTAEQRTQAPHIHAGLSLARDLAAKGEGRVKVLKDTLLAYFAKHMPLCAVDYVKLLDPETLDPVSRVSRPTLAAVAVYLGQTRLIDNMLLGPGA